MADSEWQIAIGYKPSAICCLSSAMNRKLLNTSLLLAALFAIDKVVGLGRQLLIAQRFRLTAEFDAFNVSNNLPDTLVQLLSGGALALALIPVLSATLSEHGRAAVWQLFSHIVNLAVAVTVTGAVGMALFAEPLAHQLAPQFSPAQQRLVAELMRLNLMATVLFSISGLVMSTLQAQQHFLFPALAPILYHVGQVVGVFFLSPRWGIHGLAYGVILGAALHLLIQMPGLRQHHFRWTPHLSLRDPGVRRVLTLLGPRLVTIGFINLIFIFNDRLASGLSVGVISALYYGWQIMQLPETVIGTATGTALLPTLATLVAQLHPTELRQLLRRSLGIVLALTVPATLAGVASIRFAIQLVLEDRIFTAAEADVVALATQMFLVGLTGHCLKEITARTFYAHNDAVTPVFTAALAFGVFISAATLLLPHLNFAALALANSLAFTTEAIVMLVILYRRKIL
jgi:putative peptidoglycan lipid II flippase